VIPSLVLWALIWGGMFTGPYNLVPFPSVHDRLALVQALRALLPIAAAYIAALWVLAARARYRFGWTPLGWLLVYGLLGLISSLFFSPDVPTALYWATAYLAPILVAWFAIERPEPLPILKTLLRLNNAVIVLLLVAVLPEAARYGFGRPVRYMFYRMPLGLGEVRANGVGRYAVIVLILAGVSLVTVKSKKRFAWLPVAVPALFVLMQTQSRTALLGLAVAGMLFVVVRGVSLRFLLVGPVAAYAVWISGYTWRAKGELGSLVFLTGRENIWQKGLDKIGEAPFFGWGFHADRLLLDSQHMHNSYLHAAIQAGVPGALLFAAAVVTLWVFLWRSGVLRRVRTATAEDQSLLMQSVLILGFLSARSVFESTAAFYGVDLLLFVPAVAYLYQWALENPVPET
jgi:hypothetical protein